MSFVGHIQIALQNTSSRQKAVVLSRFFKTGPGQYGAGDVFIGVTVPQVRQVAYMYARMVSISDVCTLLRSPIHEERLCALEILVYLFEKGDQHDKKQWFDFYLNHTAYVNNWDLVDTSAPYVVGEYVRVYNKDGAVLQKLAQSSSLWERRIAMVSTFAFIKAGHDQVCYDVARILLRDTHDLIHKAVGWMLREAGKRVSRDHLVSFLRHYSASMSRTTVRYAIEHFPPDQRREFLRRNK